MGGDGLLRPIVATLRDGSVPLAIIPGGRGNDYARVLGIPDDPTEAARMAVEGTERLMDVAEVDGEPYLGIASFGFDSDANRMANEAKLVRGQPRVRVRRAEGARGVEARELHGDGRRRSATS